MDVDEDEDDIQFVSNANDNAREPHEQSKFTVFHTN